ncbi:cytochrome P450 [Acrasis kona]|uniref:Cytochrome P450 n=1 Tax=Acrasis kona TaxID=1008807 RepID=A0AAW2Z2W1_9EUKA
MFLLLCLVSSVTFVFLLHCYSHYNAYQKLKHIPGHSYFTFSSVFFRGRDFALLYPRHQQMNESLFKNKSVKRGSTWKVTAGSENHVFSSSPELAKEMLVTKMKKFGKPPGLAQMSNFNPNESVFSKYFPDEAKSLFSTNYDLWKRHRSLCNKAFSDSNIKRVVEKEIENVSNKVVSLWRKAISEDKIVEATPLMSAYSTDGVSNAIFGVDFNTLDDPKCELRYIIEQTFASALYFQLPRIFMFLFPLTREFLRIWEKWTDIIKKIISERREQVKDGTLRNDVLSNLLVASDNPYPMLTNGEMTRDIAEILGAGTDTTATTLSFTLYYLAKHPEIRKKVQTESKEFISNCNGSPTYDQLQSGLPYTKAVIYEVLRVHSPAPYLARYTTEDVTADGVFIPKGTNVTYFLCMTMHNAEIWGDDVEQFRPERFIEDPSFLERNRFEYLPFSSGPRSCIGQPLAQMEMWMIISKLMSEFNIELENKEELPEEDVRFSIVPKNLIRLIVSSQ